MNLRAWLISPLRGTKVLLAVSSPVPQRSQDISNKQYNNQPRYIYLYGISPRGPNWCNKLHR